MEDHPKMSLTGSPCENRRCWSQRSPGWFCALLPALWFAWGAADAWAHRVSAVGAEAKFFRDGTYQFALNLEVQASPDPAQNDLVSPEQAVLDYLRSAITFQFDEQAVKPDFSKPAPVAEPAGTATDVLPRQELRTEARGKVPAGARAFFAKLSPDTEVALVLMVERDGVRDRRARTLFAGEISRPVDLAFLTQAGPEAASPDSDGSGAKEIKRGGNSTVRQGWVWLLDGGGRGAVLLVAILLAGISLQAAGMQSVVFLGSVFLGQLLFGMGSGPAKEGVGSVVLALMLLGVAGDNLRVPAAVSGLRYALVGFSGLFLGVFFPGKMLPGFLAGQVLAVAAGALLVWAALGGFWKQPWYGARLLRPASWLLVGVSVCWLVAALLA